MQHFFIIPYCGFAKCKNKVYNSFIMEQQITDQQQVLDEQAAALEAKQFVKMTKTPIARLVISLGIPTTLNMMVTSLYNLADTLFVSGLGDRAIGAVNVVLSLMSIIQAVGFTLGMGAGSIISRLLGERKRKEADEVASSSFFAAISIGLIISVFGLLFLTPLMRLLGAPEEIDGAMTTLEYARQYSFFILLSAPIMCASFVLNNVLRAEGKALLSMIGLVSGAVINVALDPLLIYVFDMGIRGAAVATITSQLISFSILLALFFSGKSIVRLRVASISRRMQVYWLVVATGFPSFCRQILASLCTVLLNWAVKPYDGALAALGVVQKVFMLAFSVALGIGQGYQPVLGYNYSAKHFDRVRTAYLFTLGFSTVLMFMFAVVCFIVAPNIMDGFLESENSIEIGTLCLRLQCCCMPLLPLNFMAGVTYQVVGNKAIASLLSIARQGLFYIPAVLILPHVIGLLGVQSCQSVSDICSFLFSIPFTLYFFKTLKKNQEEVTAQTAV